MSRLALITPWPPQPSGIADYAFDLALGLSAQGADVTVFTDAPGPRSPGHAGVCVRPITQYPGRACFNRCIFQMGNHPRFHSAMIPLLARDGGVVHLHDMVLQHLVAFHTCGQGNKRLYRQLLLHWYGQETVNEYVACDEAKRYFWNSDGVTDVPLFEPIVRFADSCIVHSRFAQERVQQRLPWLTCDVIPQVYCGAGVVATTGNTRFRVGVFGSVQPHKHVDRVLYAIDRAVRCGADVELHVVGELDGPCKTLPRLARELGIDSRIVWHGRADDVAFLQIMQSIDLCVALRFPTMGETSAVVSRTLQMGIPTIVNDVGWYAELPAIVPKLPVDPVPMQRALDELIQRHTRDAAFHQQARREAGHYARTSLDFATVCARYLRSIRRLHAAA